MDIFLVNIDLLAFHFAKLGPLEDIQPWILSYGFAPGFEVGFGQRFSAGEWKQEVEVRMDVFRSPVTRWAISASFAVFRRCAEDIICER